jgi:hypothetical protein
MSASARWSHSHPAFTWSRNRQAALFEAFGRQYMRFSMISSSSSFGVPEAIQETFL